MVKLLLIVGMCLQYFAFFFAVPELFGKERLVQFNNWIIKAVKMAPGILIAIFTTAVGISFSFWAPYLYKSGERWMYILYFSCVILTMLMAILIAVFNKKIVKYSTEKAVNPILNRLLVDKNYSMRALKYAAVLYSLGLMVLIVATILS
jgi:hypothetical protein